LRIRQRSKEKRRDSGTRRLFPDCGSFGEMTERKWRNSEDWQQEGLLGLVGRSTGADWSAVDLNGALNPDA